MGAGFASLAGAFCSFGPAIFLPICLWNLWITRYVPRPPAQAVGCECGEGASVRRPSSCGIPSLGEARRRARKEREFPIRKHEGRPGAPFDFRWVGPSSPRRAASRPRGSPRPRASRAPCRCHPRPRPLRSRGPGCRGRRRRRRRSPPGRRAAAPRSAAA